MSKKSKEEILQLNEKQKEFYNYHNANFATRIWGSIRRGALSDIRKQIGIERQVFEKHKSWFGDLSTKRVLDLGCYSGNVLSEYMAARSKYYVGIDLSNLAIEKLAKKIAEYPNAKALALDFLSDDFKESNFDLIYAYGVLHHFENLDLLIDKLNEKLNENGEIISYDPLETSVPIKVLRMIYRPFQTDKEWEWPFTKKTVDRFRKEFKTLSQHAILGRTKWFFLLRFVPFSMERKLEIGKKWNQHDFEGSSSSDRVLFSCMHLTMHLKKK